MIALKPSASPRAVRADLPLLVGVISGGQTGSDQAGLRAAVRLGLATGGHAPKDWRTLEGPAPWLGTEFGLVEHWSREYPPRTASNVHGSDATIRIASDFSSHGERCTLKAITKYKKPYFDVLVARGLPSHAATSEMDVRGLRAFLTEHKAAVINIAGNSESTSPGISRIAEEFLVRALRAS